MHEVSLVRNMLRTLEDKFSPQEMSRLVRIKMKIGKLSNVEPILMQTAFDAVIYEHPNYKNVQLEIEPQEVQITSTQPEGTTGLTLTMTAGGIIWGQIRNEADGGIQNCR